MTEARSTAPADPPEETDDTGAPERFADADAAVNTDLTVSVGAEDLDEDRLGADPLEEAMDPPEDWQAADRAGVTAREQERGDTLDERLAAERPDFGAAASRRAADEERGEPAPPDPDARPAPSDAPTRARRLEASADRGQEYR